MEAKIDQERLDVVVRAVLKDQTPEVRAELLELLQTHEIKVWQGDGAREEEWVLTVGSLQPIAKVHRSRLEVPPSENLS